MKKRLIALALGTIMTVGGLAVAGCGSGSTGGGSTGGSGSGETIELTLWGASNQQTMLKEMVEEFKKENSDKTYDITIDVVGESDAYSKLKTDVTQGADVYAFANDQLVNLKKIGAVARIGGTYETEVKANNDEDSVKAATIGGNLYAYPYSSDNGYFMYYDASVISAEQATTVEGVLAACQAKEKKFVYAVKNSWYAAGYFFGAGCDYSTTYDETGTVIQSVTCDFDNEQGVVAVKGMTQLVSSTAWMTGDDAVITAGFNDGSVAAAVTGTWNAEAISGYLGDNYRACKLPTFTVDGTPYQMGSFSGFKMYGVNPTSDHIGEAHRLAAFLSNESMQEKRFDALGTGPSNTKVAALDKVKANVALAAVAAQMPYARIQESVPSNFWTAVEALGTEIENGEVTTANMSDKLKQVAQQIKESA